MAVKSNIKHRYGSTIASKNQALDILAVIKEEKWNAPAELSGDNGFICLEGMQGALKFDIHGMLEFIKMSLNASDIEIRDSAIDAARLLTERDNSGGEAENFPDKQYMVHLLKSYSNELLSANEYDAFGNGLVLSSFFGFENIAPQYELNISKHMADPDAKIKFSAYKYLFSHQNSLFYKKALDELPSESNEIKYLFIESFSSNANSNKDEILQAIQLIGDEYAHISRAAMEALYLKIGHEMETGTFEQSTYKELSYEVASKVLSIAGKRGFSDTKAESAIKLISLFVKCSSPLEMKGAIKGCMDYIYIKENALACPITYPRFAFGASVIQMILDYRAQFEINDKEYRDFKAFLSDFEHYKSFEILYSNKLLNKHLSISDIYSNYKSFNWDTWTPEEKSNAMELGDELAIEEAQLDAFYRMVLRVGSESGYLHK